MDVWMAALGILFAVVLWARVCDESDQRLTANLNQKLRLRPDEWTSGDHHWVIDVAGDAQAIAGALQQLTATVFKDKPVKIVMADAQGKPLIAMLHDVASPAATMVPEARAG